MGQYWKIMNVDQGRKLDDSRGVKLLEILLQKTAEPLVDLLIVARLAKVLSSPAILTGKKAEYVKRSLSRSEQQSEVLITA